jgi:RNA polymerase sigma factor (sigma-70 family)
MSGTDLDRFIRARPRLLAIAHRIVGNVHEAEDVLQDVWLRWQRVDRTTVINVEAFLVTATIRLAINVVQSARHRHETSFVAWLDEHALDRHAGPQAETERAESIELVVHLLLERLPPAERAAFILREGFEYPYPQIADTLRVSPANARQLVSRARARVRIAAGRRRLGSSTVHRRLLPAFAAASRIGEFTGLEALLAADLRQAG